MPHRKNDAVDTADLGSADPPASFPNSATPCSPPLSPPAVPGPLLCPVRHGTNLHLSHDSVARSKSTSWIPHTFRHGLISPPVTNPSFSGPRRFSPSTIPASTAPAETEIIEPAEIYALASDRTPPPEGSLTRPHSTERAPLGKRSPRVRPLTIPSFESPPKRQRLVAPGQLPLPFCPFLPRARDTSQQPMPNRPSSFIASPEAGAAVLAAPDESSYDTVTMRLPKGQVGGQNFARSSETPGSSTSTDPFSMLRSPEGQPMLPSWRALQGVSLIDFLDQDTRPVFVVDLSGSSNAEPGPLRIVGRYSRLLSRGQ